MQFFKTIYKLVFGEVDKEVEELVALEPRAVITCKDINGDHVITITVRGQYREESTSISKLMNWWENPDSCYFAFKVGKVGVIGICKTEVTLIDVRIYGDFEW